MNILTENLLGGGGTTIIMIVLMIGVFYFMLIRPENKRKKEAEELRTSLKVGDTIVTIGGIVGTVVDIKEEKFVIETGADRVRIEFQKWALSTNETAMKNKEAEKKKAAEEKAKAKAAKKAKQNKD
jgi:preprotein translocase subunit YajC